MNQEMVFMAAALFFFIGLLGVMIRRNAFFVLMSIELMLNAVNFAFVGFSRMHGNLDGQIYAFFSMAVAASEACVGLAIVIHFFRLRGTIDLDFKGVLGFSAQKPATSEAPPEGSADAVDR